MGPDLECINRDICYCVSPGVQNGNQMANPTQAHPGCQPPQRINHSRIQSWFGYHRCWHLKACLGMHTAQILRPTCLKLLRIMS